MIRRMYSQRKNQLPSFLDSPLLKKKNSFYSSNLSLSPA